MNKYGFVLSGTKSGVGKTTTTVGLLNILNNMDGFCGEVSSFKSGPDFIDPTFHKFITKNPCYNLDLFMMGEEGVKYSFFNHSKKISVIEGAMGLYDGLDNTLDNFSSAHLSRVLKMPVILVVGGGSMSTSIAAEVLGFKMLDPNINIMGVIVNNVNSEKLYLMYKEAIEKFTGVKCLGYLEKNPDFNIDSRHLGLLQADEILSLSEKIDKISASMRKTIDIEYIVNNCQISLEKSNFNISEYKDKYLGKKVAIARDNAFSFYYEDNIEFMKYCGIEVTFFSPLKDKVVPDCHMLYFGGGYPENYLEELSSNQSMISSIRNFAESGKRVFAECGGFMYMSSYVENLAGTRYNLCGLVNTGVKMNGRLDIGRFGYINVDLHGKKGLGHEFHFSTICEGAENEKVYTVSKEDGREWKCGFTYKNVIAGYPHLHFFGSLEIFDKLMEV